MNRSEIIAFHTVSLRESAAVALAAIDACAEPLADAIEAVVRSYRRGGKVLFCGNGGSAADCQHLATELMVRLSHDIDRPALAALSLCTDPSAMTAGGNDLGFERVFERAVEGLGREGDVLIGISTSGGSRNVARAMERARSIGMTTIAFLGGDGGAIKDLCDIAVVVPSADVQRIQETHIALGHILCQSVELTLYPILQTNQSHA